jgi:hypothetical protein
MFESAKPKNINLFLYFSSFISTYATIFIKPLIIFYDSFKLKVDDDNKNSKNMQTNSDDELIRLISTPIVQAVSKIDTN